MSEVAGEGARRNVLLLAGDNVVFGLAQAFLGSTTLLPGFVRLLGGSPVAVGLLGAMVSGGWFLPQSLVGRYVAHRTLVKRWAVLPMLASRGSLLLAIALLWWLAPRRPQAALVIFLLAYAAFTTGDALAGVPWLEILGKAIPADWRGRILGVSQSLSALLAIGAGIVVQAIMARPNPFPGSYLSILCVAGFLLCLDPLLIGLVREPRGTPHTEAQLPWGEYVPRLLAIVRRDARFAWLIATRWLSGLADMAGAFYVLFASERLGMPTQAVGLFISAGVAGSLLSGAVLGPLADRAGNTYVVRVVMVLRVLCPALALLAPHVGGGGGTTAVFLLVYGAMGMANGAWFVGFTNYALSIAPPGQRTLYAGLFNTLCGFLLVGPPLAGWIVEASSYETLFAVVLAVALVGLGLALRGPREAVALEGA